MQAKWKHKADECFVNTSAHELLPQAFSFVLIYYFVCFLHRKLNFRADTVDQTLIGCKGLSTITAFLMKTEAYIL